jgi:hypothetical protein
VSAYDHNKTFIPRKRFIGLPPPSRLDAMSTTILTIVRPLQYYHNHTSCDGQRAPRINRQRHLLSSGIVTGSRKSFDEEAESTIVFRTCQYRQDALVQRCSNTRLRVGGGIRPGQSGADRVRLRCAADDVKQPTEGPEKTAAGVTRAKNPHGARRRRAPIGASLRGGGIARGSVGVRGTLGGRIGDTAQLAPLRIVAIGVGGARRG